MKNPNDRDLVLKILQILRKENGHSPYLDKGSVKNGVPQDYWEKDSNKDKTNKDYWKETLKLDGDVDDVLERLKIALERNGLVTPHPYQPYSFMITSFGLRVIRNHENWLMDDGNLGFLYKLAQYDILQWVVILGLFPVIAAIIEIIKALCHLDFIRNFFDALFS